MNKLRSWLIIFFIIMFWIFRLIVAFTYNLAIDFQIKPLDFNIEMILLFVTLFAILLIIKRNLIGGIIYVIANIYYFGTYAYNLVISSTSIGMNDNLVNLIVSGSALILSFAILIDLALNKNPHEEKDNKDTYWFYKNKKYDRKLDERADKNQYRL